ncbi:MAG: hypothetical protein ACE148_15630 [Vicinamibacterales bacterium]
MFKLLHQRKGRSPALSAVLCAMLLALLSACSSPPPDGTGGTVKPVYTDAGRLERLEQDTNADGRIDTWVYMEGPRAVRAEVDENGDQKVDRWEYYVPVPGKPAAQVVLERVERAPDGDGKITRKEFYENGEFARVEEDTDRDGRTDKWETYAGGALQMVMLDTAGAGRPTRRLTYKDGDIALVEEDPEGSGNWKAKPR